MNIETSTGVFALHFASKYNFEINMTERDISNLTPQELSNELHQLWEQFPPPVLSGSDPNFPSMTEEEKVRYINETNERYNAIWDRRSRSGHKKSVMDKADQLIDRSFLTSSGKEMAKRIMSDYYDVGIDTEPIIEEDDDTDHTHTYYEAVSLALLDLANPDSGGIFDASRVGVLERDFYTAIIQGRLDDWREFEQSTFEMGGKVLSKEEVLSWYQGIEQKQDEVYGWSFVEMLGRWRGEVVEKYGEEP